LEKIAEQFEVDWQPTIKLTANQMIEPMAAPVGFSVQAAQGTGLGPGALAQTGVANADEEIGFQKQQNSWIPPPAPGHGSSSSSGGGSGPVVSATPYTPSKGSSNDNLPTTAPSGGFSTTSSITQPTQLNGGSSKPDNSAYEEVDIFVPQIPTAPPGGLSPANGNKTNNDDDDDDANQKPGGSTAGATSPSGGTSTYEDLAARFEALGK
jgi:hypothetical protein